MNLTEFLSLKNCGRKIAVYIAHVYYPEKSVFFGFTEHYLSNLDGVVEQIFVEISAISVENEFVTFIVKYKGKKYECDEPVSLKEISFDQNGIITGIEGVKFVTQFS